MGKRFLLAMLLTFAAMSSLSAAMNYSYENKSQVTQAPVLYYSTSCPHCEQVIRYLNQSHHNVVRKNISNPQYRSELKGLGHRRVPVLVVGSRTIIGADGIINYFEHN